jgi:phage terminase large subunit-like protein
MSTPENYSLAKSLSLDPQCDQILASLSEPEAEALLWSWRFNARPAQILPGTEGAAIQIADWVFWLVLAGRGFGKTRTGAETVREWAANPNERILMIAPTADDVRSVMLEGPSGLLNCYPSGSKPQYNPSRHLVEFPSGAIGITRSAEEPARLRGPQFTKFWADELCAWNYPQDAWDQIMFGFRLKTPNLQGVITTTPKPLPVLKALMADSSTVLTRGSSYDNRDNLSEVFYQKVIKPYEGTRLGRQELNAELLEDIQGALWTRKLIDAARIKRSDIRWELIVRIVVAIDPAVSTTDESDETGIGVAMLARSGHVIVLDDLTCRESPGEWAKIAIAAYKARRADRIIGEVNNGGNLVEANLRAAKDGDKVAFRAVHASRGKFVRAEPVAALYERGMVHHVDSGLEKLEDQMCSYVPGVSRKSPDRLDWLVWAVTDLVIDPEIMTMQTQIGEMIQISPI